MKLLQRCVLATVIVLSFCATTYAQNVQGSQLFERYGMRLGLVPHPRDPERSIVVIADVRQGSPAQRSGLVPNTGLVDLEIRHYYAGIVNSDQNIAEIEAPIFEHLEKFGFLYGRIASSMDFYTKIMSGVPTPQFIMPLDFVQGHLGMQVADGNIVTAVSGPSPAAEAGFRVGDKIEGSGNLAYGSGEAAIVLNELMKKVTRSYGVIEVDVRRSGQLYGLEMPTLGIDEVYTD